MMKAIAHSILYIIGVATLLSSCTSKTQYYHYVHTPVTGWEKNDTISFDVPPLESTYDYGREINLRVTGFYPFTRLTLIVETYCIGQQQGKGKNNHSPEAREGIGHGKKGDISRDTLRCTIISSTGRPTGYGVGNYQYAFSMPSRHYHAGDSLHVTVRHDMKREILPGISDVGLRIYR